MTTVLPVPWMRPEPVFDGLKVKASQHLSRGERKSLRERLPLEYAARSGSLPMYTTESVDAYMDMKIQEARGPKPIRKVRYEHIGWVIEIGCLIIFLSAFYLVMIEYASLLPWLTFLTGIIFICCARNGRKIVEIIQPKTQPDAEWYTAPLDEYRTCHFVPDEVDVIVAEVQMRCSFAKAEVVFFCNDPFLQMTAKHPTLNHCERIYLAFWDENGFIPAPRS